MVPVHAPWSAVIRQKGPRVGAQRFLIEDRPVLDVLPRCVVPAPSAGRPMIGVVRDASRGSVEHVRQSLFTGTAPLLRAPAVPFERFLNQPLGFRAVAPVAQ